MRTSLPHEQWLTRLDISAVISTKSKEWFPLSHISSKGGGMMV